MNLSYKPLHIFLLFGLITIFLCVSLYFPPYKLRWHFLLLHPNYHILRLLCSFYKVIFFYITLLSYSYGFLFRFFRLEIVCFIPKKYITNLLARTKLKWKYWLTILMLLLLFFDNIKLTIFFFFLLRQHYFRIIRVICMFTNHHIKVNFKVFHTQEQCF